MPANGRWDLIRRLKVNGVDIMSNLYFGGITNHFPNIVPGSRLA